MPKPQQSEVRRSEHVPALSPDASEAVLSAETTPATTPPAGPVPADQQPGHHPEQEQDKPDLDAMAERLGVVHEGEEPDTAPHVSPDDSVADVEAQRAARERRLADEASSATETRRTRIKIGVVVLGPVVGYVVARAAVRAMRRPRLPFG